MPFNYQYPDPMQRQPEGLISEMDSGAAPMSQMPDPRMDYSQPDMTSGAPEKPIKQPGYRRSIKEYLEQIRQLQAAGQDVVPTFTNIQGGGMDVVQGRLGEKDVRSYVDPEYVQGVGGAGDLRRGPSHPVTETRQAMGMGRTTQPTNNIFDPGWANSRAIRDLPEVVEAIRQQNPNATPDDLVRGANAYRAKLFQKQAEMVADFKKNFKDADVKSLWNAFETGDITLAMEAKDNITSPQNLKKKTAELADEFREYVNKNDETPQHPETGERFNSASEYVDFHLTEFLENMDNIVKALEAQSEGLPRPGARGARGDLNSILNDLPRRKGKDGKEYVTYQGKHYLVGE